MLPDNRLRWRCRRGLLELDLLLKRFLDKHYLSLNAPQRLAFAALVEMQDYDLWQRVTDAAASDEADEAHVLALMRRSLGGSLERLPLSQQDSE